MDEKTKKEPFFCIGVVGSGTISSNKKIIRCLFAKSDFERKVEVIQQQHSLKNKEVLLILNAIYSDIENEQERNVHDIQPIISHIINELVELYEFNKKEILNLIQWVISEINKGSKKDLFIR